MTKHILTIGFLLLELSNVVHAACVNSATINGVSLSNAQVRTIFCQGETVLLKAFSPQPNPCNDCSLNSYTTWSTGASGDSIVVNSTGIYIATIHQDASAAINCGYQFPGYIMFKDTFYITVLSVGRPVVNPGVNQTLQGCGADTLGGHPTISFGNPPYTLTWSPMTGLSYTSTTIANPVVSNIYSPITYTLIVVDSIGCRDTDQVTITPLLTTPLPGSIAATKNGCELSCQLQPDYTYQWYHGNALIAGATSPTYLPDSSGFWHVVLTSVTYPLCKISSNSISTTPNHSQPICMVTVDSNSTHNIVVWEKTNQAEIDSFYIYRETSTNNYAKVGAVHRDSLSSFDDYSANPNVTGYRYKISLKDTCGIEGNLSNYHNSIHLQYLGGGNLQWNIYQIESASTPVSTFDIYRDSTGTGSWQLMITVPGNQTTTTDVNYMQNPNIRYRVVANWSYSCTPTRSISAVYSNVIGIVSLGINEALNSDYSIFPNPATTTFFVQSNAPIIRIRIYNSIGGIVSDTPLLNSNSVDISMLSSGAYIAEIVAKEFSIRKRWIKL